LKTTQSSLTYHLQLSYYTYPTLPTFSSFCFSSFFFNDTATTEIYTLSLHDALPICSWGRGRCRPGPAAGRVGQRRGRQHRTLSRSEEHTSELQSLRHLVCRLLLEKKKKKEKKKKIKK